MYEFDSLPHIRGEELWANDTQRRVGKMRNGGYSMPTDNG